MELPKRGKHLGFGRFGERAAGGVTAHLEIDHQLGPMREPPDGLKHAQIGIRRRSVQLRVLTGFVRTQFQQSVDTVQRLLLVRGTGAGGVTPEIEHSVYVQCRGYSSPADQTA